MTALPQMCQQAAASLSQHFAIGSVKTSCWHVVGTALLLDVIIYKEMFLGCDWLIRVQLIPNITQNSAKICNTVQKSITQCKNL